MGTCTEVTIVGYHFDRIPPHGPDAPWVDDEFYRCVRETFESLIGRHDDAVFICLDTVVVLIKKNKKKNTCIYLNYKFITYFYLK